MTMSWVTPNQEILPHGTFHTHHSSLNLMMLILWKSIKISVESVPYPPSVEPGTCDVGICYAIHSHTTASLHELKLTYTVLILYQVRQAAGSGHDGGGHV